MAWLFSKALINQCENSHSSPVQVAESLGENSLGGEPSAPSKTTPTLQACLSHDKTMDSWTRFPSGMTCEPLTESRGVELLTLFRAAFRAQTSALPEKARASTEKPRVSGVKWQESFAKYDRNSHSWKTLQRSLLGGLTEFSETWPKWGSMRGGDAYRQRTPSGLETIRLRVTREKGCGFLPTPTTDGWRSDGDIRILARLFSKEEVRLICHRAAASKIRAAFLPTPTSNMGERGGRGDILGLARGYHYPSGLNNGFRLNSRLIVGGPKEQLNPFFLEWQMGWPIGWTAFVPLATDKFQQWLHSHGGC